MNLNLSIILYNNKYYLLKFVYYSYSSIRLIKNSISHIGTNIYDYIKKSGDNVPKLEYIDPVLDNRQINYVPSAPPINLLNQNQQFMEYIMVEKEDLIKLLKQSNNKELYNKYIY